MQGMEPYAKVGTVPPVLVFDENGSEILVDRDAVAACISAAQFMDVVSRSTLQRQHRCFQVLRLSHEEEARHVRYTLATPPPRLRVVFADDDDGDRAAAARHRSCEAPCESHGSAPASACSASARPARDCEAREGAAATAAEGAGSVWSCTPLGKVPLHALRPLQEWPPRSSQGSRPPRVRAAPQSNSSAPACDQAESVAAVSGSPSANTGAPPELHSDAAAHLPAGAVLLYALTTPVLVEEVPATDAAALPTLAPACASGDLGLPRSLSRLTVAAEPARPTSAIITSLHKDLAVSVSVPIAFSSTAESTCSELPLSSSRTSTAAAASPVRATSPHLPHWVIVEQPDLCVVRPRMPFPAQAGKLLEVGCAYGGTRFARGSGASSNFTVDSTSSVVSSAAPGLTASSVTGSAAPSSRLSGSGGAATNATSTATAASRASGASTARPPCGRRVGQPPPLVPRVAARALNPVIDTAPRYSEAPALPPASATAATAVCRGSRSRGQRHAPPPCRNPVPPLSKSTISFAIALHIASNYDIIHCVLHHYIAFEVESILEALRREHPFLRCPAAQAYVMGSTELLADTEQSSGGGGGAARRREGGGSDRPRDTKSTAAIDPAAAGRTDDALAARQAQRSFTLYRQYFAYLRARLESGTVSLPQAIRNVEVAARQVPVTSREPLAGEPKTATATAAAAATAAGCDGVTDLATPAALREVRGWLAMTPQTSGIRNVLERHLSSEDRRRCEQVQRVRDAVTARTSAHATADLRAAHVAAVLRAACDDEQLSADALVHLVKQHGKEETSGRPAKEGRDTTAAGGTSCATAAAVAVDVHADARLAAALATVQQRTREVEWFAGIEHAIVLRLIQPRRLLDLIERLRCEPNAIVDLWYNSDLSTLHTLRQTVQWLNKRLRP